MFRALLILAFCAATLFASEDVSKRSKSFSYRREELPQGPWSIHVVKIDRSSTNVELQSTLPSGHQIGFAKLSQQIKALPPQFGRPVAAINGDYYETDAPYKGDPQGLQILRGELVSAPCDWTCFWLDPAGKPTMGKVDAKFDATLPSGERFAFGLNERRDDDEAVIYTAAIGPTTLTRGGTEIVIEQSGSKPWLPLRASEDYFGRVAEVKSGGDSATATNKLVLSIGPKLTGKLKMPDVGDIVRITTATKPSLKGVQMAIGGGPAILRGGKFVVKNEPRVRHPRSAIGWNDQFIFLVEVDGRQPDLSVGMTWEELGNYMAKIGCKEAMGFDGGGSATMWVGGQVMNNPSEGGERGMANCLVLLSKDQH
ncbi:MAG TPA: phosphodiester glycosidase family protein [Verrucomicrobiae bacterium]|nr:phosphodiester glycosidase family protein [Verrucomicrobiae bacterium]